VQLIVVATFVGVLVIFLSLYWMLVVRSEAQARSHLKRRLKSGPSGRSGPRTSVMLQERQLSPIRGFDTILGRAQKAINPLQRLIEQAGSNLSVGLFLTMSWTCGLAGYLLVTALTPYRAIGVLVGVILLTGPYIYLRWKRGRRLLQFEEKFPEAIDLIARALRAGHAFTTGLGMVADEIPAPVGAEFRLLYEQQNFGMPLPEALRSFGDRIPILDARFFATAVLTQREAGGNLSEVLDNLSRVVRERFKVKRQVRVISAHARITGWVLVCLPPVTALGFAIIVPDMIKLLVTDPLGVRMVVIAICLQITGGMIVKKLVNIEY